MNRSSTKMYNKMCKLYENGEVEKAFKLATDLYYNRLTLFDSKNIVIDVLIVLYEGNWKLGNDFVNYSQASAEYRYRKALGYMELEHKVKGDTPWGFDMIDIIEGISKNVTNSEGFSE